MNKILIFLIFLTFSFNSSVSANELKCKKFIEETKEYQKKGLKKVKSKLKISTH